MLIQRTSDYVLSEKIEVTTLGSATQHILELAERRQSAYVCFATAHMIVKATQESSIHEAYAGSAFVLPDGAPVAWCLRLLGHGAAQCVSGPRTVPALLRDAASCGVTVGFYGGRPGTLQLMQNALLRDLPHLKITYVCSPPFRSLNPCEQQAIIDEINESGTQLLFIGLGSPKQELWMNQFSPLLNCVCLGVGAAFEFLSGEKILPPYWVQRLGLTWLVRLCQEPRRLLKRNLYSPVFAAMFFCQKVFGMRFHPRLVANTTPGSCPE